MVRFSSLSALAKRVGRVLVVGSSETFAQQASAGSFLEKALAQASAAGGAAGVSFAAGSANPALLRHALANLQPGADSGDSAELLLLRDASDSDALRVSLHALPTLVSRANSPARPHAISSFVKSHRALPEAAKGQDVLVLLLLPTHELTWFAAAAAVARTAPQYAHKLKTVTGLPLTENEDDGVTVVFESELKNEQVELAKHTANGIQLSQRLVDAPPNELHSDAFVQEALAVAKRTGAKATVIQGEELREKGFGGIYGVGKAATHPPALVVLSHYPAGADPAAAKGVALVGKGIIYDTGGLNIKVGGFMSGMKRDMGGAASLLGAFEAAVLAKNTTDKTPLHVLLCIAENSVGPLSARPDDIHVMYSGKTVEINNTDAEGRLVLGDGVAYAAKHLNPKVIVDMATLTGAQGIATGQRIGAVYTNDEDLERLAVVAGKRSGDLVHPMPYAPEFFRAEFKSTVADMKNSVKNRANAQVSCAGQFVGNHLGDYETNGKWLHVDMAYPIKTDDDERSTGFGVAFIQSLLQEINAAGW